MRRVLLVSPYFIDSYRNNISMGSAVKLATNLSLHYQVKVLTTGRRQSYQLLNPNLSVESAMGLLIPDPINYMVSPSLLIRFIKLITDFKPDIVIVSKYMFFSSFVIPLARIMNVKVITVTDTFPGINWFSTSILTSAIMWTYARLIGIPLLRWSNKVVLLYSGLESIAQKYRLNYTTIPNGVESQYLKKSNPPLDITKPKNEFWVGFVGRPESAKGFLMAQAVARNFISDPHIKFIFVGGQTGQSQVENISFLGFRSDIMQIYQLFDCLIMPSHAEGLPNVAMEAMSQGVPVIASAVGGLVHLIDSTNGILVNSQSVSGFTTAISNLKADPWLRQRIGRAAKLTIATRFNWDKIILSYRQLIHDICAE